MISLQQIIPASKETAMPQHLSEERQYGRPSKLDVTHVTPDSDTGKPGTTGWR
jgi:hypothetical protein